MVWLKLERVTDVLTQDSQRSSQQLFLPGQCHVFLAEWRQKPLLFPPPTQNSLIHRLFYIAQWPNT